MGGREAARFGEESWRAQWFSFVSCVASRVKGLSSCIICMGCMAWNSDFREGLLIPVVENQMEKIMDNELEAGVFLGVQRENYNFEGSSSLKP